LTWTVAHVKEMRGLEPHRAWNRLPGTGNSTAADLEVIDVNDLP